jgi:hypothetical protein
MWKKLNVAKLILLSQHLGEEDEKNNEIYEPGNAISWSRFETWSSRIRSSVAAHNTALLGNSGAIHSLSLDLHLVFRAVGLLRGLYS